MERSFSAAVLALGLAVVLASPAAAVPLHGRQVRLRADSTDPRLSTSADATTEPRLRYHNGSVVLTSVTHAIYWIPPTFSVGPAYQATLDQYFADVAAASGQTDNVYQTLTQYFQDFGSREYIAYDQTFAGSIVDTHAFPTAHRCTRYARTRLCITDLQIIDEIERLAQVEGWTGGPTDTYTLFLPDDVGTCLSEREHSCANKAYCAYHWQAGRTEDAYVYAVIPYPVDPAFKKGCGTRTKGVYGNDADYVLDSTSHEHREMLNDPLYLTHPLAGGWWDKDGWEGSDKCEFNYGTILGTTVTGAPYNQLINGSPYMLQMEWSNAQMGCVQEGI